MTFQRVKPYGWQVNEKVTSPQLNQLDLDHSNALDKTGDDVATGGGISGEIGILPGGSIQTQGGSIDINSGDVLYVNGFGAIEASGTSTFISLLSNATLLVDSASHIVLQGNMNVAGTGNVYFQNTSLLHMNSGTLLDGYGTVKIESGGALDILSGGLLNINSGADCTISLGSGSTFTTTKWAQWATPQVRTIVQPIFGLPLTGSWTTLIQGISSNAVGNQFVIPLTRLHNGATLNLVVVDFQVWQTHSGVPANLPSLSVLRYTNGSLSSAVALGIPDPQAFFPPPASGSAWYDSQNTQYLVYDCVHNNVIDNSQYTYYVVITDESGSNSVAENNYGNVTLSFNAIPDQSWQI